MARQLFPRWTDTALRFALIAVAGAVPAVFIVPAIYLRTPYATGQQSPQQQPVAFDHRHHVQDNEIACLYCHSDAERSPHAGVPPTELCMGCHSQIWVGSPKLEPVYRSYFSDQPIAWKRVHSVPDFVYFNHAVHVKHGVDCSTCHGDVAKMATPVKVRPMTMGWCLDCHRHESSARSETAGLTNAAPLTNCSTCHR